MYDMLRIPRWLTLARLGVRVRFKRVYVYVGIRPWVARAYCNFLPCVVHITGLERVGEHDRPKFNRRKTIID